MRTGTPALLAALLALAAAGEGAQERPSPDEIARGMEPTWTADGRWIVVSVLDGDQRDLFALTPDGAERRRLTSDPGRDDAPAWSPDGRWVAFVSDRSGHREVHAIPADAGMPVRLTDHGERCGYPAWSPDGSRLVYTVVTEGRGNDRVMLIPTPAELRPR